ncbi:MAG: SDR family NAD(P)-dependent oxidoreductase [Planctomycetota bacterium]|nr:SDR family NAD(P)-dependent oxidoreductase [Planctomycetota bacterium]
MNWSDDQSKWAVITGASSGIGRSFALAIARRGMNVALVARREDRLKQVAAECEEFGVETELCIVDLREESSIDAIEKTLGARSVALLVNNAGVVARGPFHGIDEKWQRDLVYLNSVVPAVMTRRFLPPMLERDNGAVIFVSSTSACYFHPEMATYASSKLFSMHLGEHLAWELRHSNVHCQTVIPGVTITELFSAADLDISNDSLPPGYRMQSSEKVAEKSLCSLGKKDCIVVTSRVEKVVMRICSLLPKRLVRAIISKAAKGLDRTRLPVASQPD